MYYEYDYDYGGMPYATFSASDAFNQGRRTVVWNDYQRVVYNVDGAGGTTMTYDGHCIAQFDSFRGGGSTTESNRQRTTQAFWVNIDRRVGMGTDIHNCAENVSTHILNEEEQYGRETNTNPGTGATQTPDYDTFLNSTETDGYQKKYIGNNHTRLISASIQGSTTRTYKDTFSSRNNNGDDYTSTTTSESTATVKTFYTKITNSSVSGVEKYNQVLGNRNVPCSTTSDTVEVILTRSQYCNHCNGLNTATIADPDKMLIMPHPGMEHSSMQRNYLKSILICKRLELGDNAVPGYNRSPADNGAHWDDLEVYLDNADVGASTTWTSTTYDHYGGKSFATSVGWMSNVYQRSIDDARNNKINNLGALELSSFTLTTSTQHYRPNNLWYSISTTEVDTDFYDKHRSVQLARTHTTTHYAVSYTQSDVFLTDSYGPNNDTIIFPAPIDTYTSHAIVSADRSATSDYTEFWQIQSVRNRADPRSWYINSRRLQHPFIGQWNSIQDQTDDLSYVCVRAGVMQNPRAIASPFQSEYPNKWHGVQKNNSNEAIKSRNYQFHVNSVAMGNDFMPHNFLISNYVNTYQNRNIIGYDGINRILKEGEITGYYTDYTYTSTSYIASSVGNGWRTATASATESRMWIADAFQPRIPFTRIINNVNDWKLLRKRWYTNYTISTYYTDHPDYDSDDPTKTTWWVSTNAIDMNQSEPDSDLIGFDKKVLERTEKENSNWTVLDTTALMSTESLPVADIPHFSYDPRAHSIPGIGQFAHGFLDSNQWWLNTGLNHLLHNTKNPYSMFNWVQIGGAGMSNIRETCFIRKKYDVPAFAQVMWYDTDQSKTESSQMDISVPWRKTMGSRVSYVRKMWHDGPVRIEVTDTYVVTNRLFVAPVIGNFFSGDPAYELGADNMYFGHGFADFGRADRVDEFYTNNTYLFRPFPIGSDYKLSSDTSALEIGAVLTTPLTGFAQTKSSRLNKSYSIATSTNIGGIGAFTNPYRFLASLGTTYNDIGCQGSKTILESFQRTNNRTAFQY